MQVEEEVFKCNDNRNLNPSIWSFMEIKMVELVIRRNRPSKPMEAGKTQAAHVRRTKQLAFRNVILGLSYPDPLQNVYGNTPDFDKWAFAVNSNNILPVDEVKIVFLVPGRNLRFFRIDIVGSSVAPVRYESTFIL
jgi:hypothetical protein